MKMNRLIARSMGIGIASVFLFMMAPGVFPGEVHAEPSVEGRLADRPWTTGTVHTIDNDISPAGREWTTFGGVEDGSEGDRAPEMEAEEATGQSRTMTVETEPSDETLAEELTRVEGASIAERSDEQILVRFEELVLFESGSDVLTDGARETLDDLAAVLQDHGEVNVAVQGHTNNVPVNNERFSNNMELSTARANAARDYLVEQGVAPERLQARGFGATQPVASNDTPEGLEQNRRVDFVFETGE